MSLREHLAMSDSVWEGVLQASSRKRPGMLLKILQCTTKNIYDLK